MYLALALFISKKLVHFIRKCQIREGKIQNTEHSKNIMYLKLGKQKKKN